MKKRKSSCSSKSRSESGDRFKSLVKKIKKNKSAKDAKAIAASIGRKKYGKKGARASFQFSKR